VRGAFLDPRGSAERPDKELDILGQPLRGCGVLEVVAPRAAIGVKESLKNGHTIGDGSPPILTGDELLVRQQPVKAQGLERGDGLAPGPQ